MTREFPTHGFMRRTPEQQARIDATFRAFREAVAAESCNSACNIGELPAEPHAQPVDVNAEEALMMGAFVEDAIGDEDVIEAIDEVRRK